MAVTFLDIATTPDVMDVQYEMGSDTLWQTPHSRRQADRFGNSKTGMIATCGSLYPTMVSQNGWPHIQHRGDPVGFLHLLDDTILTMADFGGSRQYITTDNLRGSARACLFLVDYPRRARLEIYATVEVVATEDHLQLLAQVAPVNCRACIERLFLFHLQVSDWNCLQHITPRYGAQRVTKYGQNLQQRIHDPEQESQRLQQ